DRHGGRTWLYRPGTHKTEHHDVERVVFLGPQAQEILEPFLNGRHPGQYLFVPREAMEWLWGQKRKVRKTRVQPSQVCRKRRRPQKSAGDCYTVQSYERAIAMACRKAGVPHWSPNQLRHAKATELRK